MTTFATRDDILTLLVHLGYLTYDVEKESVRIPNKEVAQEYIRCGMTLIPQQECRCILEFYEERLLAVWQITSLLS